MSYDYSENILVQESAGNLLPETLTRKQLRSRRKRSSTCSGLLKKRLARALGEIQVPFLC